MSTHEGKSLPRPTSETQAYADPNSSILALVKLAGGPQMTTNIVDCEPDDLSIGDSVTVVFKDWTDEISVPKFKRA